MAETNGAHAGLLQKVGVTTNAGTLGTLILVGVLAKDAFAAQLEATERALDAIEDVREVAGETQAEVGTLKRKLESVETAGQRERDELERRLRAELDELRTCVLDRKRCKR